MPIVTLISDWNQGDYYLAAVKGKLLSLIPNLNLIDISHQVISFSSRMAAFILRNSYRAFPSGTIHVLCVNSLKSDEYPHVAVFYKGHYFIGADNGIFSLILDDKPERAVYLDHSVETTFPEYDVFAEAAAYLANGGDINQLGQPYDSLIRLHRVLPTFHENTITGMIVYVDSYGNLISNISKDFFYQKIGNQSFDILLDWGYYKINKISEKYEDKHKNELIALFNSLNLLEIALVGGSASAILNIHEDAEISIRISREKGKDQKPLLLQ
ncbi:MAG: SAM-dependent chlorinase/fluorinase [Bacteroidales bacterium]|nr:SAM-dependent chlorinase/fluorinase [Bacteroidales bacterium]